MLINNFLRVLTAAAVLLLGFGTAEAAEAIRTTFTVTAYYSPELGQQFYLTGNYDDEIRLNGGGIQAADGTAVRSGMLAAPRKYGFGTKIYLDGFGVGTVHDRGGAIVPKGQRRNRHDRIDIWVGRGEAGLRRALQWGRRDVSGWLYPAGEQRGDTIAVTQLPQASITTLQRILPPLRAATLRVGHKGQRVRVLQQRLSELGFLRVAPTGYFGAQTRAAVVALQLDRGVIGSRGHSAAGLVGPKTQAALGGAAALPATPAIAPSTLSNYYARFLPQGMGVGDRSAHVSYLQLMLRDAGYLQAATSGSYGAQTVAAVRQFQLAAGVITAVTAHGNGHFGPKTQRALLAVLTKRQAALRGQRALVAELPASGGVTAVAGQIEMTEMVAVMGEL